MDLLVLNPPSIHNHQYHKSSLPKLDDPFYYDTDYKYSVEEIIMPLRKAVQKPKQLPFLKNLNFIDFNKQRPSSKAFKHLGLNKNSSNNTGNKLFMNKSPQNYKIIEDSYFNMQAPLSQSQHSQQQQQQSQNSIAMENFMSQFKNFISSQNNQITEEHIDLTNGANNGINGRKKIYAPKRKPSFQRHLTIPFGNSQDQQVIHQGVQRSHSAQNIYVDSKLAEGERNLNYCIRFAVNGLSKAHMGGIPSTNRNIQSGDFGDDAGMIAENSKCIVIGLADGAGGNRDIGIDPKKFSRSLLGFCVEIIKNEEIQPHQMAKLATKAVQHLETRNIVGSGTLCLLSLNKDNNIMTAMNMGDSGFRLVRSGKICHKSNATMAGSSPRQVYVSESMFSGISFVDEREIGRDSDLREFRVKKGDIIVMSSDGLFDVIRDNEIERIVNAHNPKDLQGIADELLNVAMRSYVQTCRDDILIMVCRVEMKKGVM